MGWPLAGLLLALLPSAPAQPLAAGTGRGPARQPCGRTAAGVSAVPAVRGCERPLGAAAGGGLRAGPRDGAAAPAAELCSGAGSGPAAAASPALRPGEPPGKLPGAGVVRKPRGSGQGSQYTGEGPAEGHGSDEGYGASLLPGEIAGAGPVYSIEEKTELGSH